MKKGTIVKLTAYDPVDDLNSEEAIVAFKAEAQETNDPAYIVHALGVAAAATGRNSQTSSNVNSVPPTVNLSQ